jgi:hypothetical protein
MFCDTKMGEEIHADEVLFDRVWVPRGFVFNDVDGRRV